MESRLHWAEIARCLGACFHAGGAASRTASKARKPKQPGWEDRM